MRLNQYFTKKIVIITSIVIVLLIMILIIVLYNNTTIFKSKEEIKNDLLKLQEDISTDNNNEIINLDTNIDNKIYSNYVGVSNGTLYVKEDAKDKIKESVKNTKIGYEKIAISENGLLVLDAYENTNAIECKIISNTKDKVSLTAYSAQNLCDNIYTIGSIEDKKIIEEGKDELSPIKVAKNTVYTISNSMLSGLNTIFFFDSNGNFISNTTDNTFTTTNDTSYIKVITEDEKLNGIEVMYCLVLGTEPNYEFITKKTDVVIDVENQSNLYFPLESEKIVIYVDGGEIEMKYVSK